MIKMQIIMDNNRIKHQGQYTIEKIGNAVDEFLVGKLGFVKAEDGFYLGNGGGKDFSYFGIAFNTLRKKTWFIDNVETWLYYNSDASDDPDDFVIEDFKAASLAHKKISA
jgi:hypothetical protein